MAAWLKLATPISILFVQNLFRVAIAILSDLQTHDILILR